MNNQILINGNDLTIDEVYQCARQFATVSIDSGVEEKLNRGREFVKKLIDNSEIVYGITTGYGPLCNRIIAKQSLLEQQRRLIYSLSSGVGDLLPEDVTRAIMLARANVVAKGNSGVRPSSLQLLLDMINNSIHPCIYSKGSLGASGDLIHLGQLALCIIGDGDVQINGKIKSAKEALSKIGKKPVELEEKEGLAFVNGTSAMTGMAALAASDFEYMLQLAELTSAFLLEIHYGSLEPFFEDIHLVRPHSGQIKAAQNILAHLKTSKMTRNEEMENLEQLDTMKSHVESIVYSSDFYVQDPYSIRCVPQVLGAVWDLLDFCKNTITIELNSTTDNPIIISDKEKVIHGGNFYGQQISFCSDILSMGITKTSILAERQIDRLVNEAYNKGLPAMLVEDVGHNSGFAGAQMAATSLVVENRMLSYPASIQSIPSNANNQDVVSMGTISSRRTFEQLSNLRNILAIEILCLCQAADFREVKKLSSNSRKLYENVRAHSKFLDKDRPLYKDIDKISKLILDRTIFDFNHG